MATAEERELSCASGGPEKRVWKMPAMSEKVFESDTMRMLYPFHLSNPFLTRKSVTLHWY